MSNQPLSRKPSRPRRAVLLALAAGVGALFLLWRQHRAPERLAEFPTASRNQPLGVYGDELYIRHVAVDQSRLDVRAMPLHGGPERHICSVPLTPGGPFNPGSLDLKITRTGIYYRTWDRLPEPTLSGPQPIPPPLPPTHGLFSRQARAHLWLVPLSGGSPREVLPDRKASSILVVGDHCYWLESTLLGPGEPLIAPLAKAPKKKLFAMPLSGRAPRLIAELRENSGVRAGTQGVFWNLQPALQGDLAYVRPPDFALSVIPNVYGYEPPREVGNRLYWLDADGSSGVRGLKPTHQLVSVALDGGDRRVDLDVAGKSSEKAVLFELTDDGASLIVNRGRTLPGRGTDLPRLERALCAFRPGEGKLQTLVYWKVDENPAMLGVTNGFAYYAITERRENWWDWSTKGLIPKPVLQVFRVPIPR